MSADKPECPGCDEHCEDEACSEQHGPCVDADKPEAVVMCRQCSEVSVEPGRETWATPVCFACLPPPKPLPGRPLNPAPRPVEDQCDRCATAVTDRTREPGQPLFCSDCGEVARKAIQRATASLPVERCSCPEATRYKAALEQLVADVEAARLERRGGGMQTNGGPGPFALSPPSDWKHIERIARRALALGGEDT